MANRVYLAVDLGASSGRVIAGVFDGRRLTLDELHRFAGYGHDIPGSYHWDVLALHDEIRNGLALAARKYGKALVSVGVDTWGVDYALLDRRGRLLGLPHQYRDPRTNGMEKAACRRVPREKIYEATGIQFMFFNTLFQLLSQSLAKSSALAGADRLLFMPDLFHYWLSGCMANERTIASTSQMLDPRTGRWAVSMLRKLGLPTGLLKPVSEPGTVLGEVLPEVREATGVGRVKVVLPGSHDTASAVAAVPAKGSDHVYLSSGTWSLMGVESPAPVITPESYRLAFTNEGGVNNTIRLLKNLCGLWLIQESKRVWAKQGQEYSFADLSRLASAARPFLVMVDTDAAEFGPPGDMPARIRAFCRRTGQKPPAGPGELVRGVLESLALRYRMVFAEIEQLTGRRHAVLHVVGGGAKEKLLNQFAADALGKPVIAGPVEATATGNILVQMIASGALKDLDQGRELVRRSFPQEVYEPRSRAAWDAAYECWSRVRGA